MQARRGRRCRAASSQQLRPTRRQLNNSRHLLHFDALTSKMLKGNLFRFARCCVFTSVTSNCNVRPAGNSNEIAIVYTPTTFRTYIHAQPHIHTHKRHATNRIALFVLTDREPATYHPGAHGCHWHNSAYMRLEHSYMRHSASHMRTCCACIEIHVHVTTIPEKSPRAACSAS